MKLYIYGYLNRVRSSSRLEREAHRNIEGYLALARPEAWLQDHRLHPDGRVIRNIGPTNQTFRLACYPALRYALRTVISAAGGVARNR